MAFERRPTPRGSAASRGLGRAHQLDRERLLRQLVEGTPCPYYGVYPRCLGGMYRSQRLDRDHSTPRALGGGNSPGRLAHSACNQWAGARLGAQITNAKRRQGAQPVPAVAVARRSRAW